MEMKDQIIKDINSNPIVLFMKGTKEMPMCGFSATVVKVLSMDMEAGAILKMHSILEFKVRLAIGDIAASAI